MAHADRGPRRGRDHDQRHAQHRVHPAAGRVPGDPRRDRGPRVRTPGTTGVPGRRGRTAPVRRAEPPVRHRRPHRPDREQPRLDRHHRDRRGHHRRDRRDRGVRGAAARPAGGFAPRGAPLGEVPRAPCRRPPRRDQLRLRQGVQRAGRDARPRGTERRRDGARPGARRARCDRHDVHPEDPPAAHRAGHRLRCQRGQRPTHVRHRAERPGPAPTPCPADSRRRSCWTSARLARSPTGVPSPATGRAWKVPSR